MSGAGAFGPGLAHLVVAAAACLHDGEVCFVGIGSPSLAAMYALRTHAPNLVLVYESGVVGARPRDVPLSTGSETVIRGAAMVAPMTTVFGELQAGRVDVGLLSGAQVDGTGNVNSTRLGPREQPRTYLAGSGGAHDIGLLARRTVILMPHDPRRFADRVDHVTTPGLVPDSAVPHPRGPATLVTDRARFAYRDGEVVLDRLCPGVEVDAALDGIPWPVRVDSTVEETVIPSEADLAELSQLLLPGPAVTTSEGARS
jgi:glutaconate CoA-transferase subunit B